MKKNLKIEYVAISKLKPFAGNPRKNDESVDAVVKSIEAFGYTNPILVRRQNNEIIAGHTRLKALQKLGATEAPVIYLDLNETDARTYAIFDNKSVELADWDFPKLADLFVDLDQLNVDLDLTGFTAEEIDLIAPSTFEPQAEDDAIPEAPEPISKTGDLWLLGEHRLLCGDATKKEDVDRLMAGRKARMGFTSPPYGIELDYGGEYKDTHDECVLLLRGVASTAWNNIVDGGFFVINFGDVISGKKICKEDEPCEYPMAVDYWPIFRSLGWLLSTRRIWAKPHARVASPWCASSNRGASDWEHLWFWKKPGAGLNERRNPSYFGVWDTSLGEGVDIGKDIHVAPMAVALPVWALTVYSNHGDSVLEPFAGTGTTLIACEKLGHICYGMEIEPRYVDVAVKRWEQYTGKTAKLDTGRKLGRKSKKRPTRANVGIVGAK